MKTDTVFKRAFNDALDLVSRLKKGDHLPSENVLSADLGVSRTTVRKVLASLATRGIITGNGRQRILHSARKSIRRFPEAETVPLATQVEKRFMEWMLRDNARPGTAINELELARQFGVATSGIREFLNRFQRFGLIEKRPNAGWVFKGFTTAFALELFEIREMFEKRSAIAFVNLPEDSLLWQQLASLRREHRKLLVEIESRFHDFSDIDSRFHRLSIRPFPIASSMASTKSSRLSSTTTTSGTNTTSVSATKSRSVSIWRISTPSSVGTPRRRSSHARRIWHLRRRRCCGRLRHLEWRRLMPSGGTCRAR